MGKLGDLWIRLGLKKENFDKGLDQAKTKVAKFGESAKSIGTKFKAAWAVVGAATVAAVSGFIKHSQKIGDAWDQQMSRMKSAWGQFLTTLTSWDWDGFWGRVKNGADAAQKSTAAHDAEFEVKNAIQIKKAQMSEELALMNVQMRNTKLSYEERAKYADMYLEKVKSLYQAEIDMRQKTYVADTNEYLANAGLSQDTAHRDALMTFLTDIAPDEDMVNALIEWSKHAQGKSQKLSQETIDAIEKIAQTYGNKDLASFGVLARYYLSTGDDEAKKVVDAISAYFASKAAFDEETRRIQNIKNTAEAQGGIDFDSIDTGDTAALDDPRVKQANTILERLRKNSTDEVTLLTEKYSEEKALLEQFGLETWQLTNEYLNSLQNLNGDYLDEIIAGCDEFLNDFDIVEVEPIKLNLDPLDEDIERLKRQQEQIELLCESFKQAIVQGFSAGMQELMDQLFGLEEVNAGAIFQALLEPMADVAVQAGELVMAEGIAIEASEKAFKSLNGYAAIAAGAALIAIGSAAKSGLRALANSTGSSTTTSTSSAASSGTSTQQIETSLTIYVEGRISGSDIVISGQRTANSWNR